MLERPQQYQYEYKIHKKKKHRKNCECCPRQSLFKGHKVNVNIVVLNCHQCNQCLKCQVSGHKSLGLLLEDVFQLNVIVFVIAFCCSGHVLVTLITCLKGHRSLRMLYFPKI